MKTHTAIISIGSNIDPETNVKNALAVLKDETDFVAASTIIKTAPEGFTDQPDFLNGAALVRTPLSQADFNRLLKDIEDRLGRVRGPIKAGPRTIDLDLIGWDHIVVHDDYPDKAYVRGPVDELLARHAPGVRLMPTP